MTKRYTWREGIMMGQLIAERAHTACPRSLPGFLIEVEPGVLHTSAPIRFDASPLERRRAYAARIELLEAGLVPSCCRVHPLARAPEWRVLVVGSSNTNANVVLPYEGVSYRHAQFLFKKNHMRIVDLESPAGTWVEGHKLPAGIPMPVVPGQIIRFGSQHLMFTKADGLCALLRSVRLASRLVASSRLQLPARGVNLRELIPDLTSRSASELASICQVQFLLEVPTHGRSAVGDHTITMDPRESRAVRRRGRGQEIHVHSVSPGFTTVGRGSGDVVLSAGSVSKRHAQIACDEGGGLRVVDLESRNGTWMGGRQLTPGIATSLRPGSPVSFGRYTALYLKPEQLHRLAASIAERN